MKLPEYFESVFKFRFPFPGGSYYRVRGDLSRNTVVKYSACYLATPVISRHLDSWLIFPSYEDYKKYQKNVK